MIDLFGIASNMLGAVNPMREIILKRSLGYQTNEDFSTSPTFEEIPVMADIQDASTGELMLTENMQQQGEVRSVYLRGCVRALSRPVQAGGDMLVFDGSEWLVTAVKEQWGENDWCKVLATRQIPKS